ncbi:hypothetical protein BpHYR1_011326 [Brachionus plicatilis]|uniref:Uncharacterized protein n=1 Tax=Brachionus plicatilis TaxID=10195 RepID=A0A3M7Q218_BRAPC|nr:hypothetical protein BpHYR1_011326 [Brachionus plicatilis]
MTPILPILHPKHLKVYSHLTPFGASKKVKNTNKKLYHSDYQFNRAGRKLSDLTFPRFLSKLKHSLIHQPFEKDHKKAFLLITYYSTYNYKINISASFNQIKLLVSLKSRLNI